MPHLIPVIFLNLLEPPCFSCLDLCIGTDIHLDQDGLTMRCKKTTACRGICRISINHVHQISKEIFIAMLQLKPTKVPNL